MKITKCHSLKQFTGAALEILPYIHLLGVNATLKRPRRQCIYLNNEVFRFNFKAALKLMLSWFNVRCRVNLLSGINQFDYVYDYSLS